MAHRVERNLHLRISGGAENLFKCKKSSAARAMEAGRLKSLLRRLERRDGQHLAAFVVAAGRAGAVRWDRAPALAALVQSGCVKAVCGLACAQAHFGHLAFWNSHGGKLDRLKLSIKAI
jgi:hypothetical protein